jgi:hypothetical protein
LSLLFASVVAASAMAQPRMTAVTFYGAGADGTVIPAERWNTIAPHPAWDVYVAEGAIPGGTVLNDTSGDRHVDHALALGDNVFTFAVSHLPDAQGGDLAFDYYGLNVFVNGNPQAVVDEAPEISGLVATDRDGPGGEPAHTANTAAATMGFPLADLPGAGLTWTDGSYTVELTDYFVYSKFDAAGNHNAPDFDVMRTGSNTGPFVPDGNQDVVGQFTLTVVPEPSSVVLLGMSSLALLALRRRR